MRATFAWSPSETRRVRPSFRFTFGDFEVRMCRVFVWPRLILPVAVLLKRLAAPVWVFNLGILSRFSGILSFLERRDRPLDLKDRDLPASQGLNQYIATIPSLRPRARSSLI